MAHFKAMMHSFQMMYNTMGSKVDGLAVRDHYLSKNALKTAFLADTILDHLNLERASTYNFNDYDLFHGSCEKFRT